MTLKTAIAGVSVALILAGCSFKTTPPTSQSAGKFDQYEFNNVYNVNLSKYMNKKLGKDCSGFVSLVNEDSNSIYFNSSELDNFYDKEGRKSQAIFNLYQSQNKIYFIDPKPGDLVFFSNTTHNTKTSKQKKITHLGIIQDINSNGTISFVHNTSGKNIKSVMNLKYKNSHIINGKKVNAYIITKCQSQSCLVSNKFAGFGKVEKTLKIN
ncbi:NlpC/P60 family protein [Campylobacter fetus]|uniref:NlpC/P60 domain-containing protein n=1 Tax=Campylobacter fetus subsp. testudinum TaxID=1507806 RepID=A0AAX0HCD8_CAMFE|nr:NlpC/P60 family protein [Campylobacter fetus]AGZ81749.1 hypothetical protein CFT03427_0883 [Campylobacter fetus subsp. testudinum 03-427]AJB45483.1 hypothetical protein CR44_04490 [Campylobacter fetus subsp. testudinum]ALV64906.1 hypothetical protein CFTSP3_0938 [Campylobacter fetus subsp. testudinum Sp3]AVK81152.1 hypothetical protein C6B32_04705 [Campylobacter fetus subsp. testudinum]EAI4321273.1 hypothetical protein [Campylobacter fetus]